MSPEDFIFLVRYDRAKVNRLRTYLSWKEVRKNAKEDGGGPGDVDLNNVGADDADMAKAQGGINRKLKVKLPWEISSVYTDYVVPGATSSTIRTINAEATAAAEDSDGKVGADAVGSAAVAAMDDELDEDDEEAMRDSLMRLKEADEATLKMTREEYEHYADCRTASFTFRKAKKFREFIASSNYLDVKPNDDIVDILGFLAFEVVREITLGACYAWEQERREQRKMLAGEEKRRRSSGGGESAVKKRKTGSDGSERGAGTSSSRGHKSSEAEQASRDIKREDTARSERDTDVRRGRSRIPVSRPSSSSPTKEMRSKETKGSPAKGKENEGEKKKKEEEEKPEIDYAALYPRGPFGGGNAEPTSFCGLFGFAPAMEELLSVKDMKPAPLHPQPPASKEGEAEAGATAKEREESSGEGEATATKQDSQEGEASEGDGHAHANREVEETPILLLHHVREAFARLQRDKTTPMLSTGTSVGGPIGGLRKSRQLVI